MRVTMNDEGLNEACQNVFDNMRLPVSDKEATMGYMPTSEYEMETDCYNRLLSYPGLVKRQVNLGDNRRIIDICHYHLGDLTAFELKMANWRQAINQASDHALAADFCYVVMPGYKRITKPMTNAFSEFGIGLIFYRNAKRVKIRGLFVSHMLTVDLSYPFKLIFRSKRFRHSDDIYRRDVVFGIETGYAEDVELAQHRLSGFDMTKEIEGLI